MAKVGKLPTMPHVASKILELVSDPDTSARKLQQFLDSDQVLAMRILKVANSALFALPRKIQTLQQAIVMLGFNHIRSLVLAEALQNLFKGKDKGTGALLEAMLWEHSVGTAIAAKTIARTVKSPLVEEAFIAGLSHDIGKLIMLQGDPERYDEIIQIIYSEYEPFSGLERRFFDVDHAEVGAALTERWNLHEKLAAAIASHHDETKSGPLIDLVQMANAVAWKAGWGFRFEPDLVLSSIPAAERLMLQESELDKILSLSKQLMNEERSTFGVQEVTRRPNAAKKQDRSPQQVT
jgi:putative nucleotidyltransferase with HDIG domain